MKEIEEYFKQGLLFQFFQAKRNIIIWTKIANEVEFLNKQSKEIQELYSFLQFSATTNFVLHTVKIFDNPSKRYQTRCILSFFELIKDKVKDLPKIIEKQNTKSLLIEYKVSNKLIDSINSLDSSLFPLEFYNYFLNKYKLQCIQEKINDLKYTRDKVVAHNEVLEKYSGIELEIVEFLLRFVIEIISIFGQAYYSTGYDQSRLTIDAETAAYFITNNIDSLKKTKNNKLC